MAALAARGRRLKLFAANVTSAGRCRSISEILRSCMRAASVRRPRRRSLRPVTLVPAVPVARCCPPTDANGRRPPTDTRGRRSDRRPPPTGRRTGGPTGGRRRGVRAQGIAIGGELGPAWRSRRGSAWHRQTAGSRTCGAVLCRCAGGRLGGARDVPGRCARPCCAWLRALLAGCMALEGPRSRPAPQLPLLPGWWTCKPPPPPPTHTPLPGTHRTRLYPHLRSDGASLSPGG